MRHRESYSTHHVHIRLLEEWRENVGNNFTVGGVLMDLSKAFDCIPQDLLIAKLSAYGLNGNALKYTYTYQCDQLKLESVSTSEKSPEKKQSFNANDILSNLKVRVNNKLIIGNLNINSIAGKFDQLKLMVQYKVDILVLTETKIGSCFLNQQFHIEDF